MVRKGQSLLIGAILLSWLVGSYLQAAAAGRTNPNSLQQSGSASAVAVRRDTLLNGLQLIVVERAGTGKVSVHLRINSGAMFDLADKGGLADITAEMLLRGGAAIRPKGISDLTNQLGLTVNVGIDWDSTDIVISGSSTDFDTIVELLAKLILKPAFDQKELDSFKADRVEQILSQKAAAGQTAKDAAMRLLFGRYPFGHPVGGTADSIGKITRDDLVLYHDRFYIPNNSELLVEGDVSAEDVTRIARSQLGVWGKGGVVPPNFVPPASLSGNKIVVLDSAASTGTAVLAQIGVSRRAEDYFADLIVGKLIASAAGKLGSSLGAQYTSSLEARYLPGPLVVQVDAPIGNLLPATQAVVSAMANLIQGGASEDDVNRMKGEIIASFASSSNTDAGRGDLLLEIEQYGLGRDYSINFADRLNAVSIEEITAAAGKHLKPGALAIAVVGPASQLQTAFAKLGPVSVAK